jgi:hypothetical protein
MMKVTSNRNLLRYNETNPHKMSLLYQSEKEMLINYGGRFNQLGHPVDFHYFNAQ